MTGRLGSWPRFVVAFRILLAMSVLSSIDSGSPGGGPGDLLGDAEEGVRRLTTSMCWDSWLNATSGRSSMFRSNVSKPAGACSESSTSSSAAVEV